MSQSQRNPDLAEAKASRETSPRRSPVARLDQQSVLEAYARWAPVYDLVFGRLAFFGRFFDRAREAVIEHVNTRAGRLLEVGVGTGIALGRYGRHLRITGVDLSPDMLALAVKRVAAERLDHVERLAEMDASALGFDAASFDTVVVMFTITVVPQPDQVMAEVARVLKPGGEAILVSHFASDGGWRQRLETALTPFTRKLGWSSRFPRRPHPRPQRPRTGRDPPPAAPRRLHHGPPAPPLTPATLPRRPRTALAAARSRIRNGKRRRSRRRIASLDTRDRHSLYPARRLGSSDG